MILEISQTKLSILADQLAIPWAGYFNFLRLKFPYLQKL